MEKKKRVNKGKEEIVAQMAHTAKIERMKVLVRLIWPFIQDQATIYDAQTVVNATAGFIKQELVMRTANIVVKDLEVDLSKEADSPIKAAMVNLLGLLQTEKADETVVLLQKLGDTMGQYGASKYLQNPMADVNVDDFIAS